MSANASQLERLTFFSDAVFAIAITLLIIEVHVPHLETRDDQAYWQALQGLQPSFMGFALSFLVIGALWVAHHRVFGMLVDYSAAVMWPNMLLLMTVAFMPFATALMSSNPMARVPELVYAGTLLVAGSLQRMVFAAALRPPLVRTDIAPEHVVATRWRSLGLPTAALLSLIGAWFAPGWNNLLLLTIPLFVRLFYAIGLRRTQRLQLAAEN
ncbi:TMEM175 family protein [Dyella sp. C9]|uniref:TMEM175 family protein n=1 Tax=Dyella sp. C9 TaxID=2202154 RepID=UPI000DEFF70A|nr:TMEM175 family protein [Dyella sp. C9]